MPITSKKDIHFGIFNRRKIVYNLLFSEYLIIIDNFVNAIIFA